MYMRRVVVEVYERQHVVCIMKRKWWGDTVKDLRVGYGRTKHGYRKLILVKKEGIIYAQKYAPSVNPYHLSPFHSNGRSCTPTSVPSLENLDRNISRALWNPVLASRQWAAAALNVTWIMMLFQATYSKTCLVTLDNFHVFRDIEGK